MTALFRRCLIGASVLWFAAIASQPLFSQSMKQDTSPGLIRRHAYLWYVTAAAIHRVTLKPETQYWRFDHFSIQAEEAEAQLRTWENEGIDAISGSRFYDPESGTTEIPSGDKLDFQLASYGHRLLRLDP